MIRFIVNVVTSGYNIFIRWMLGNSLSACFIPWKVPFDACAIVGMSVRWFFMKDGGRNASFFCSDSVAVCVACEIVSVLTVRYCVHNKNQYSTYCAVLSQVLATEVQCYLPNLINLLVAK